MGVASVRVDRVEFGFERIVALAPVFLRKTDFAAFFSTVAEEFVDAFVGLWVDDEWHKL
jgi:hypothetical protein